MYTPDKHGKSLSTFYRKTKNAGPNLLLIMDEHKYCFGAFVNENWKVRNQAQSFYGTGECFLFSFNDTQYIRYYRWTKKNNYFMYSNLEGLSVGSGEK